MTPQISSTAAPVLRGYLHLAGALVAPYALLLLLFIADSPTWGRWRCHIWRQASSSCNSTSATYHLLPLGSRLGGLMKRLDHAIIFLFIAGAYVPFTLKLLSNAWGIPVLSVVGGLAGVGFITTLAASAPPRWIRVGLYVALGWVGIVAIPELLTALPGEAFAMLILSGILFFGRWNDICHQAAGPLPICFRIPRGVSRATSRSHCRALFGCGYLRPALIVGNDFVPKSGHVQPLLGAVAQWDTTCFARGLPC